MRSLMTVAALAATAFAVPAMAQDGTASSDTAFSGPRVEGLVGWDRVQNHGHDSGVAYGVGAIYALSGLYLLLEAVPGSSV